MQKEQIDFKQTKNAPVTETNLSLNALTCFLEKTKVMRLLGKFYSQLLGEEVSARQTVYYFYAQAAGTATLFPLDMNPGWRACLLLLFLLAANQTRK